MISARTAESTQLYFKYETNKIVESHAHTQRAPTQQEQQAKHQPPSPPNNRSSLPNNIF